MQESTRERTSITTQHTATRIPGRPQPSYIRTTPDRHVQGPVGFPKLCSHRQHTSTRSFFFALYFRPDAARKIGRSSSLSIDCTGWLRKFRRCLHRHLTDAPQVVACLRVWTGVIAAAPAEDELRMLIFPLAQVGGLVGGWVGGWVLVYPPTHPRTASFRVSFPHRSRRARFAFPLTPLRVLSYLYTPMLHRVSRTNPAFKCPLPPCPPPPARPCPTIVWKPQTTGVLVRTPPPPPRTHATYLGAARLWSFIHLLVSIHLSVYMAISLYIPSIYEHLVPSIIYLSVCLSAGDRRHRAPLRHPLRPPRIFLSDLSILPPECTQTLKWGSDIFLLCNSICDRSAPLSPSRSLRASCTSPPPSGTHR